ncbi:MAG: hypothetical protein GY765_08165 [bacterium]|nr:hypothetical protein [bacterium]
MSGTDTKGWDLVGGITQTALNREIALLFSKGYLPTHIVQDIDEGIISGSIDITLGEAVIDLGGVTEGMAVLNLSITKGTLKVKGLKDFDLDKGTITVSTAVAQIEVETEQKQKQILIYLDFLSKQTSITVKVEGPELTDLQKIVLNALLSLFFNSLKEGKFYMGTVDLTGIDVPDYLMPKRVAFSLVPDKDKVDLNELIVMVQTLGAGGEKPYREAIVPKSDDAVLLMANERLLSGAVGEALASELEDATFAYSDNNYYMTNTIEFQGYDLRGANVSVSDGAIHIKLNIAAMHQAGGGVNIYINSDTSITMAYDAEKQEFVSTSTTPDPATSWDFEWWVYLSLALIAVIVGLVYGIIAIVVSVIIGAIAGAVASPEAGKAIGKAFKSALLPIKWPAGELLVPTAVNLPKALQIPVKVPES